MTKYYLNLMLDGSGRYGLSPKLLLQGGELRMFLQGNILLWSFQRAVLRTEVFHLHVF